MIISCSIARSFRTQSANERNSELEKCKNNKKKDKFSIKRPWLSTLHSPLKSLPKSTKQKHLANAHWVSFFFFFGYVEPTATLCPSLCQLPLSIAKSLKSLYQVSFCLFFFSTFVFCQQKKKKLCLMAWNLIKLFFALCLTLSPSLSLRMSGSAVYGDSHHSMQALQPSSTRAL